MNPTHAKHSLYRLYIDEVGNHDMGPALREEERFLTLFGVWTSLGEVAGTIQPEMGAIKEEFFQSDPDNPVIFHRKDISRFRGAFSVLYGDPAMRKRFGDRMLKAYGDWAFVACAVTIDKREHLSRYQVWRHAPYHYCLEVLLERYVLYLHYRNLKGDVMIEARNPTLDEKLKASFSRLYREGTGQLPAELVQNCLTSSQIKLSKKSANVTGLQLADLLAHSAHYDVLLDNGLVQHQESEYGKEIARILNSAKYNRDARTGRIPGYGKKLLP